MDAANDGAVDADHWIRKIFPRAIHQERIDLIDRWRGMQGDPFVGEIAPPSEEELLRRIPRAEIGEADMGKLKGRGAYATVHEVSWNGEFFAMKSFLSRTDALRELNIQYRLVPDPDRPQCPHIVPARAFAVIPRSNDAETDRHSIVMELLDGSIDRRGGSDGMRMIDGAAEFEAADALEIMLQLARALAFMHSRKVMHRDVKPGNILYRSRRPGEEGFVRGNTTIKLADFGTSLPIRQGSHVHTSNRGTKFYKAPEVIREDLTCPYTDKADVYSFAMTCYAIGTGRTPLEVYENLSPREFYRKVAGWWWIVPGKRPKLPQWMDPDLTRLLRRCWQFEPEKRPPMSVVCWALEFLVARAYGGAAR